MVQRLFESKKSPENWKNSDFETLAALMDVSNSTVKRLFECKGYKTQENFNSQIKEKLIRFLGYTSWGEIEKACYLYILQNGIGKNRENRFILKATLF